MIPNILRGIAIIAITFAFISLTIKQLPKYEYHVVYEAQTKNNTTVTGELVWDKGTITTSSYKTIIDYIQLTHPEMNANIIILNIYKIRNDQNN